MADMTLLDRISECDKLVAWNSAMAAEPRRAESKRDKFKRVAQMLLDCRRALAIAQAVDELKIVHGYDRNSMKWIMRRADELLEGK